MSIQLGKCHKRRQKQGYCYAIRQKPHPSAMFPITEHQPVLNLIPTAQNL